MITSWDVYVAYRKAQANYFNRGYRLPKDWDHYWENKLNKTSKDNLIQLTDYFNTKWSDINVDMYMEAGFEVFKSFSYKQFLDRKIIKKYISRDKQRKREYEINKRNIINSIKYVKSEIGGDTVKESLIKYCDMYERPNIRRVISDYLKNRVDVVFVVFLIKYGFFLPNEFELDESPYLKENRRKISVDLDSINGFCEKILEK